MSLPSGVVDPLFMYELAEHLHMTVAELCHGRGTPMPLHELVVGWPQFYASKRRVAEREAAKRGEL